LVAERREGKPLEAALSCAIPEVLVDMIAYTEADAGELVTALPGGLSRLVLISSGDVYASYGAFLGQGTAHRQFKPATEDDPLRSQLFPYRAHATSPADFRYHYEKILVERRAQELAPVPVTILRLPMVYGPGDPQQRVQGAVRRLRESRHVLRLHPQEATWRCTRGYVEDVARAIVLATSAPQAAGQTFNVGEREAMTEREWLGEIGHASGWTGEVVSDSQAPLSMPAQWKVPLIASTEKIRKELGFIESVGRREGIRRSLGNRKHMKPAPTPAVSLKACRRLLAPGDHLPCQILARAPALRR
jgi:nucleoside-diphosphate-sugar epimerase